MNDIGGNERRLGWLARATLTTALAAVLSMAAGCESKSDSTSKAQQPEAEEPAVEWTPAYEGAHAAAEDAVGRALETGLAAPFRKSAPG